MNFRDNDDVQYIRHIGYVIDIRDITDNDDIRYI